MGSRENRENAKQEKRGPGWDAWSAGGTLWPGEGVPGTAFLVPSLSAPFRPHFPLAFLLSIPFLAISCRARLCLHSISISISVSLSSPKSPLMPVVGGSSRKGKSTAKGAESPVKGAAPSKVFATGYVPLAFTMALSVFATDV
jgi:hypothetical protein